MKTKNFILGLLIIGLFFVVNSNVQAEEAHPFVENVSGKVMVTDTEGQKPLTKGMKLKKGDFVVTGEGASIDVVSEGHWGYRLLGNSKCRIDKWKPKNSLIDMIDGNIIVRVQKFEEGNNFVVRTPAVVASVRGTQFWGRVKPAGANSNAAFAVREGQVEVNIRETGKTVTLNAGDAIEVETGLAEVIRRPAAQAELDAISLSEQIKI